MKCRLPCAFLWLLQVVDGFVPAFHGGKAKVSRQRLYGLLEDLVASEINNDDDDDDDNNLGTNDFYSQELEDLYHTLIFSGNTQHDIARQLEACSSPDFIQYLTRSMDASADSEERQGLQELLNMIKQVQMDVAKKEAEETAASHNVVEIVDQQGNEEPSSSSSSSSSQEGTRPVLSNADVLKRANQIDKAVAKAALSDDEKSSDFISDCREVVNLSGGFNSQGQMRVGGR